MDDIVRQALAKWPNVPHCYGWLALDARGCWRMRDERAQAEGLAGERIGNAALTGFINRNYLHDEKGCWYFQNGPQRVYVDLEATPHIARTDPAHGFLLHTGEALADIDAAWMTETGQMILQGAGKVALLDDRDLESCITQLRLDGAPVGEQQLLEWLDHRADHSAAMTISLAGRTLPVKHLLQQQMPAFFGFVQQPRPAG